MKTIGMTLAVGLALVVSSAPVAAPAPHQRVTIDWKETHRYTDVMAVRESQQRFEKRLFKQLTDHLEALARKQLKRGHRLQITVHDIDLAGEFRMNALGPGDNGRVVKPNWPAAIDLEHRLIDPSGKPVHQGREILRGRFHHHSGPSTLRRRNFHYEKVLLEEWFSSLIKSTSN